MRRVPGVTPVSRAMLPPIYCHHLEVAMRGCRTTNHSNARWRDLEPGVRDGAACFAVVRNPWSRVVSRYTFGQKEGCIPPGTTFRAFLDGRALRPFYWHRGISGWFQQRDYVVDADGCLRCDILRLEELKGDLESYLGYAGPVPHENRSATRPYADFYDAECRAIVADWYWEDIEYFGFTFGGPATKNIIS